MSARCPGCGHRGAEGHAPDCGQRRCGSCGGQFSRLSNAGMCGGCVKAKRRPPHDEPTGGIRGAAVLICYRARDGQGSSQITSWATYSDAVEADALAPCDEGCRKDHAIVHRDDRGRIRTTQLRRPDVDNVRQELRAALNGDGQALDRLRQDLPKGET